MPSSTFADVADESRKQNFKCAFSFVFFCVFFGIRGFLKTTVYFLNVDAQAVFGSVAVRGSAELRLNRERGSIASIDYCLFCLRS